MTAPKNTMTKSYIQQRITARKASLVSKIAAAQKLVDAWWDNIDDSLQLLLDERVKYANDLARSVKQGHEKFDKAKNVRERYAALQSMKQGGWTTLPSIPSGSNTYYANDLAKAIAELESAQRELALLEHAEAYLSESPMEDYSITALTKLGLIEAVKFSLVDTQKS